MFSLCCTHAHVPEYFQRQLLSQAVDNMGGVQPDDGKHAWQRLVFQQVHKTADNKYICLSVVKRDQVPQTAVV